MFNFSFHKPYSSRAAAKKLPHENLCAEKVKLIKVLWRRKTLNTACDLSKQNHSCLQTQTIKKRLKLLSGESDFSYGAKHNFLDK